MPQPHSTGSLVKSVNFRFKEIACLQTEESGERVLTSISGLYTDMHTGPCHQPTFTYRNTYTCKGIYKTHTCTCTYSNTHTQTYIYIHTYIHMYIQQSIFINMIYIICTYYIYIYIHMHIQPYIYTHTHTNHSRYLLSK